MSNSLAPLWRGISRTLRLSPTIDIRWVTSTPDTHQEESQDCRRNATVAQTSSVAGPVLAIVGQPNVGKSALFNALVGGRRALVYNTPGHGDHVTRDVRSEAITLRGGIQGVFKATVCDTPGLEMLAVRKLLWTHLNNGESSTDNGSTELDIVQLRNFKNSKMPYNKLVDFIVQGTENLQERAAWKVVDLLRKSHLIIMVVDARKGICSGDEDIARLLDMCKGKDVPVILVINKSEREADRLIAESDAYTLTGIDIIHSLSAETKIGVLDLQLLISQNLPGSLSNYDEDSVRNSQKMNLAFVGLPNVGKSSLVNAIVEEERMLTGPEKGLTRDSIAVQWGIKGDNIELIDTAGWKKPQKIYSRVEQLAHANTQRVLKSKANIVGLVLDPVANVNMGELFRLRFGNLLNKGDILLLSWLAKHQKAIMVIVNKMDLVPKEVQESIVKRLGEQISYTVPEITGLPIIPVSAKSKIGVLGIIDQASKLYYNRWNVHINTSRLNQWLAKTSARVGHGPSTAINRIRFICQTGKSPPVFTIDVRGKNLLKRHERRFIENAIRNDFQLNGIPVKVIMRPRINPYVASDT